MTPLIAADIVLGLLASSAAVLLRRSLTRRPPADPDDRVAGADIDSALRGWGAAVLILGLLAISGLPGGFDQPLWSAVAMGLGAVAAAIFAVRWRYEDWALRGADPAPDGPMIVESETWQFAVLAGGAAAFVAYFIGLSIGLMQPVHAVVAVLEGAAGSALGYAIWTPRTAIRRRSRPDPEVVGGRPPERDRPSP